MDGVIIVQELGLGFDLQELQDLQCFLIGQKGGLTAKPSFKVHICRSIL